MCRHVCKHELCCIVPCSPYTVLLNVKWLFLSNEVFRQKWLTLILLHHHHHVANTSWETKFTSYCAGIKWSCFCRVFSVQRNTDQAVSFLFCQKKNLKKITFYCWVWCEMIDAWVSDTFTIFFCFWRKRVLPCFSLLENVLCADGIFQSSGSDQYLTE